MENNIFMKMHLIEKVKLEPAFITKSYREEVLKRLKARVEGICTRHGFIRPGSIELHKVCTGRVELIGLNGNCVFDVHFTADVCNPLLGSVIRCRVTNVNKFGILAEAGSIIEAIIAKNSVNIVSDVDLEKIRIGDEVMVEVVGKKYELNDKKISLIGKIVRNNDLPRSLSMEGGNRKRIGYDNEIEIENDNEEEAVIDDDVRSLAEGSEIEAEDAEDADAEEEDDGEEEDDDEDDDEDANEDAKEGGNFFSDDDQYFNSDIDEDIDDPASGTDSSDDDV